MNEKLKERRYTVLDLFLVFFLGVIALGVFYDEYHQDEHPEVNLRDNVAYAQKISELEQIKFEYRDAVYVCKILVSKETGEIWILNQYHNFIDEREWNYQLRGSLYQTGLQGKCTHFEVEERK